MSVDEDFDLAAGGLRADQREVGISVEVLAAKLEQSLPEIASVERRKVGGFRSKRRVVERIRLAVGEEQYEIARGAQGYQCTCHKVVRGITLSRKEISMAEWLTQVISSVSARAEVSEQSRAALEGLLG